MKLKRTPLYEVHKRMGGKIVEFAGWEMPVQYEGVLKEHRTVRSHVGMFDVSHMGEIEVKGPKALDFCQLISTNDAAKLNMGQVQYSAYCMPEGGLVDDFTLFRTGTDRFLFIVNASNKDKDLRWMMDHSIKGAEITDLSDKYSLLAVQGPLAEGVVGKVFEKDLSQVKFYGFVMTKYKGSDVMISRTGYTGEDGFEVMMENRFAQEIWDLIMKVGQKDGIAPIGLGARDTLRMEMGYALYGHEINEKTNPLEAGLGWIVKFNKDFLGKETLLKKKEKGLERRLTGFKLLERGVPREKYPVFKEGSEIGFVTSGTFSPSLEVGLGICYVKRDIGQDEEVEIGIRDKKIRAKLQRPPFVKGSVKK